MRFRTWRTPVTEVFIRNEADLDEPDESLAALTVRPAGRVTDLMAEAVEPVVAQPARQVPPAA